MKFSNLEKVPIHTVNDLNIIQRKYPFNDSTNVNMPKVNTEFKKQIIVKTNPSKYKNGKIRQTLRKHSAFKGTVQKKQASVQRNGKVFSISNHSKDSLIDLNRSLQISLIKDASISNTTNKYSLINPNRSLQIALVKDSSISDTTSKDSHINPNRSLQISLVKDAISIEKQNPIANNKNIEKYVSGSSKNYQNRELVIKLQTSDQNKYKARTNQQNYNIRQSTPLVKRLRKGNIKNYLESTLEESTVETAEQNVNNNYFASSSVRPRVLIYNQIIQPSTKTNLKDPYALDIIDDDTIKHTKKKKLNDSAKFNRTMHNVLEKIEKKEKKRIKKKQKYTPGQKYENNIKNVLKRVINKLHQHTSPPGTIHSTPKCKPSPLQEKSKSLYTPDIESGFCGFERTENSYNNIDFQNDLPDNNVHKQKCVTMNKHLPIKDNFHGFENSLRIGNCNTNIEMQNIPSTSKINQFNTNVNQTTISTKISILNNISLNTPNDEILMESVPSSSKINQFNKDVNQTIISKIRILNNISLNIPTSTNSASTLSTPNLFQDKTNTDVLPTISFNTKNLKNLTSLDTNPMEKSNNLFREFHEHATVFNEPSVSILNEEDDIDFNDVYVEDSEPDDDEYFGFVEDSETTPEKSKRISYKRNFQPWRFKGFFKRNPHFLKIKKNGLPCIQQELVLDYEFVQRIEALSANKHTEEHHAKSPVQTTMLDFVESTHDHPEPSIQPSLFDYDEFKVAKPLRKVLGVIQNNQIVSTPKKTVQAIVTSPNVSIIPREGDEENSPLSNNKKLQKSYRRLVVPEKKADTKECELDDGIMPSILDKDYEEVKDTEVNLFEDVEKEEDMHFNITLPNIKYDRKRRKRRLMSEGSDNEDKKARKKKKKNMMTEAEEANFDEWAAKMNARFAEDEKFELTIE